MAEICSDKIPPGFDGQKLLRDLKKVRRRYLIASAIDAPIALVADADAVLAVAKAALSLVRALEGIEGPLRSRARQNLTQALPPPVGEWNELLQMTSGGGRLVLLLAETRAAVAGARKAEKDIRALVREGAGHQAEKNEASARRHLQTAALPELYATHLRRKCGMGIDGTNDRPTEGLRFVVAASKYINVGASPDSVFKDWKRARATSGYRDVTPKD